MDWKKIYEEKKCTAKEAVQSIKSNDRVVLALTQIGRASCRERV